MTLEQYIEENENKLYELWDSYKYEKHYDLFHYDDVDYFNEELFNDMCEELYLRDFIKEIKA